MKLHRFIINDSLRSGTFYIQDADLAKQWQKVLKLQVGEEVVLSDGLGQEAKATIVSYGKKDVEVKIAEIVMPMREPEVKVVLYCAVIKRDNFEWVVQKATELGVSKIVPVISERTVKQNLKLERLRQIAKEAAEQSGRCVLPEIVEPIGFEETLDEAKNAGEVYFAHTESGGDELNGKFQIANSKSDLVIKSVFIGPEGGWTEAEVGKAIEAGCKPLSLGELTLRAETASVIGVYTVLSLF